MATQVQESMQNLRNIGIEEIQRYSQAKNRKLDFRASTIATCRSRLTLLTCSWPVQQGDLCYCPAFALETPRSKEIKWHFKQRLGSTTNTHSSSTWHSFTVDNAISTDKQTRMAPPASLSTTTRPTNLIRWVKAGNSSLDLLNKAGFGSKNGLDFVAEQGRNYFGDYLHNFDGQPVRATFDVTEQM
ncbi:MAG: hypothetical protein L6R35_003320 [Caloplaca aegaea]|nr:MAG: hypothetical protein L6R35_003320 [Caloplaca aegaea]